MDAWRSFGPSSCIFGRSSHELHMTQKLYTGTYTNIHEYIRVYTNKVTWLDGSHYIDSVGASIPCST